MADELHKPARKRFQKRSVFAKKDDDIWTAYLVDILVTILKIKQWLQILSHCD